MPKVILNAARISRGPWRLAAFVDRDQNVCSQRFHGLWPTTKEVTCECLAAILNGPIANIFATSQEPGRDNRKRTIQDIPCPRRALLNHQAITAAVNAYLGVVASGHGPAFLNEQAASDLLLRIRSLVLSRVQLCRPTLKRRF